MKQTCVCGFLKVPSTNDLKGECNLVVLATSKIGVRTDDLPKPICYGENKEIT